MMLGSSGGIAVGSSSEGGSSAHGDAGGGGGGEAAGGTTSIMSGNDEKGPGGGGGDFFEGDRSSGGNRWPRQETIALLKIRSDMDAVFRDSSLKGPLWEEISRKMAEHGYHRSAKKCKEKFENVYKYHKRTKDGRVGKSEGKTYRFFDQLEAFDQHHSSSSSPHPPPSTPRSQPLVQAAVPVTMVMPAGTNPPGVTVTSTSPHHHHHHHQYLHHVSLAPMPAQQQQPSYHHHPMAVHHGSAVEMENGSSPSATPSSSSSTSSDEELIGRRKRKRKWKGFFEKMMKEVIDKQEELQKRFLDVVEKREHDRLVREETWKAQEMDRLNRKHEMLVQERSMLAAKDAALIEILKKLSDQHHLDLSSIQAQIQTQTNVQPQTPLPPPIHMHENIVSFAPVVPIQAPAPPSQPQLVAPIQAPPQPKPMMTQVHMHDNIVSVTPPQPKQITQTPPPHLAQQQALVVGSKGGSSESELQPSSSRWPKAEIDALINLRTKLDQKYQEGGPKGPLWEEISSSMKNLGYNRNAKRCKEKWENINKYYKKVKESNKKRPEDSKTCPYFDQLDALYREKTTTKTMDINTITTTPNIITNAAIFGSAKPNNPDATRPIFARPEQQWPPSLDRGMEDAGSDNGSEDDGDDDDDDDEQGSGGYEIVANTSSNNNNNNGATTLE